MAQHIEQEKLQRLISEVRIFDVVNYLGIPYQKRGCNYFISCPSPEHNDKHATNCYFKEDGIRVRCLACGYFASPIELVRDVTGMGFLEAVDVIWNLAGCPSYLYEEDKRKRRSFILSYKEAKLIGIKLPNQIYLVKDEDDYKCKERVTKERMYAPNDSRYLLCEKKRISWRDFLSEKELAQLVYNKAIETKKRYQEMLHSLQKMNDINIFPDTGALKKAVTDIIEDINGLLERAGRYA